MLSSRGPASYNYMGKASCGLCGSPPSHSARFFVLAACISILKLIIELGGQHLSLSLMMNVIPFITFDFFSRYSHLGKYCLNQINLP